ncbi:prepilin peptidase [Nitrospirales bacterium NOB]|nr:prepilin peptidase [Nitrospira sp. NTP2]MDL1888475.1 prepilin peptidase [Nitrospirales bacterium NOB]QOJ37237.1 MAG: preprotein translocase subunit SecA [Nitrospira sp.]RIK60022.1 MAG: prepilin peptidase [Nitrospira sp.]
MDRWAHTALTPVMRRLRAATIRRGTWIRQVTLAGADCASLRPEGIRGRARDLRASLTRAGFQPELAAQAFALVREAASRTVGMRHFDVQLLGGWILLTGRVAEMETGEGKTLTATLPACTAALAGLSVHIVTVNDYLAARDADLMRPIYEALGLSVGTVLQGMSPADRRAAYACDITYCTGKELAFDYLKDRLLVGAASNRTQVQLGRLHRRQASAADFLLRGLHYAIVDEADSILIDEAKTPLVIARCTDNAAEQTTYAEALHIARQLVMGRDFVVDQAERTVRVRPSGDARAAELAAGLGGVWRGRRRRDALVHQALVALHLFHRDQQYLVQESKVQIIDEYTGRVMPDRSWEHGLHQMIQTKERCPLDHHRSTMARISYQRFFRRYLRLAGMTGTAQEVASELWGVYRLGVVRVPPNRPVRRKRLSDQIYATADEKWQAVVVSVSAMAQRGRPVLVGTRTVAASEHLSRLLQAAGLPHQVLNARQDRDEAAVISRAAEPGRITVATNMAGRGTDIRLDPSVVERGGLHVIATERHEAGRIDRQLFGRCGRQGDPGSYQTILALDDEVLVDHGGWVSRAIAGAFGVTGMCLPRWVGGSLFRLAQRRAERVHARMRRGILKMDEQLDSTLAFSGRSE